MDWNYTPYALPFILAAVIAYALLFIAWQRRPVPAATPFVLLMAGCAIWSLAYAWNIGSTQLSDALFWVDVEYIGIATIPLWWFLFAARFAGYDRWLTRRNLALLAIIPAITILLTWTTQWHGLMYSHLGWDASGPIPIITRHFGVWYWVHLTYSYLLTFLGTAFLIRKPRFASPLFSHQAAALVIAALFPWVSSLAYLLNLGPVPHYDLTPAAFTLSGLVLFGAVFRFRFLTILPMARDAIFENMSNGVIVLDATNRIVDLNLTARNILGDAATNAIGQPAAQVFSGRSDLVERFRDVVETRTEIVLGEGQAQHYFDLQISPLYEPKVWQKQSGQPALTGWTMVLNDITARKSAEEGLRRRDAILDAVRFAAEQFLKTAGWEQNIREVLAHLGQAARVSRVYLFENQTKPDGTLFTRQRFEWVAPGIAPQIDNPALQALDYVAAGFARWIQMLNTGQLIHGHVRDFPASERTVLAAQGVQSIVIAPIFSRQQLWGFIGFDECSAERKWSAAEMSALEAAANTLGAAIEREQVDQALRARAAELEAVHQAVQTSEGRYRTLLENLPLGVYRTTPGPTGKVLMANPALVSMFGFASEEEIRRLPVSSLYSDPSERRAFSDRLLAQGIVTDIEMCLKKRDGTLLWGLVSAQVGYENGAPAYFDCTIQDITARKQAEESLREKITALQALSRIQQDITSTMSLSDRLDRLLEHLLSQMHADIGVVALLEPGTGELCAIAQRGAKIPDFWQTFRMKPGEGAGGWIVQNGVALSIPDVLQDNRWIQRDVTGTERIASYLGVPLRVEGRVIGTLDVATRTPRTFTPEEIDFISTLAGQTSISIQNARLFEETQRRADQLAILNRIASAINRTMNLDEVLEEIRDKITATLTPDSFYIALYDAATNELDFRMRTDQGVREPPERRPLQSAAFTAWVVTERKPLRITDWEKEKAAYPAPFLYGTMQTPRSWLGVPLLAGGRVVGVISVQAYRPNAYDKEVEQWLSTIADQVAVAIERARLLEEAQRRALEQSTISAIVSALNATVDVRQAFPVVAQGVRTLIACDRVSLALLDEPKQDSFTMFALGEPSSVLAPETRLPVTATAAATDIVAGRVHLTDDLSTEQEYPAEQALYQAGFRSRVNLPLAVGERSIGALNLVSQRTSAFAAAPWLPLQQITSALAIAIENSRLFEAEQTRRAELTALNRIALAVSQSLDLDAILNSALAELTQALGVRGGWISLVNPATGELVLHASSGGTPEILVRGGKVRLGEGFNGRIAQDRQARALNLQEANIAPRDALVAAGYQSIAAAPLLMEGSVVGVLGLAAETRDRFGEVELRLLGAVGSTISVALNNVRLFESIQKQVAQLATLREIDRTLSSMLDLAPMLETMLSSIAQIIPYDSAAVSLLDETGLYAVAARGRGHEALAQFALDVSNNAIFQEMVKTQAPVLIGDVHTRPEWLRTEGVEFTRAWLGAPLIARGTIIGQIGLFSETPNAFTREHSDLLRAFANHAAIAIANTRLRAELHAEARRDSLTRVLNHGTFIAELRVAAAQAMEDNGLLAMIMLDLDNFKRYNDTYGHVVGDQVLTVTVQAIRVHIKQNDLVGRWGGEEFAIALRGTDVTGALRVATRIRETLAATPVEDRHGQRIPPPTVSQGIAAMPATTSDVDELIEQADRALYHAKKHGKDQVAVASAM